MLNEQKREMVLVCASLNRINWLCEHEVRFNENTSTKIDWESVGKDKKAINALKEEFGRLIQ